MLLLIDNYDSFVHNLARYLSRLGAEVVVLRNDSDQLASVSSQADSIVLSPGPCGPEQSGQCVQIVRQCSGKIPILGVCLGHQIICHAFGGRIVRASRPIHGMSFPVRLYPCRLFQGLDPVCRFARYHSLIAEAQSLPDCLRVVAESLAHDDSHQRPDEARDALSAAEQQAGQLEIPIEIMAVAHTHHATFGVQFHPESILSEQGYRLLSNFLEISGMSVPDPLPTSDLQIAIPE